MDDKFRAALEKQNPWWFNKSFEIGIERPSYHKTILKYLKTPEILLLVGARRSGKSTLLYQIIKYLIVNGNENSVLFINLDEPLFQSKADDPSFLGSVVSECLEEKDVKYVFIDEIQNYEYWAQTVKTFYDTRKDIKFILTGSSSTLIHSRMATKLSGRFFHIKVFPLSFIEFLAFNNVIKPTTVQQKRMFMNYLKFGAFPRVVLERNLDLKQELLKSYFQTIFLKDIIFPHNLRNNKDVFDLLYFVLSNAAKPLSYTRIAKILGVAVDTVKEYLGYAEESYLISMVTMYNPSVKRQMINPKKVYCLDTGIINSISFKFSENKGRLLENLVLVTLLRCEGHVFYHKEKYECDFLVKKGLKVSKAIQVTVSIKDEDVKKRELKGLLEAMKAHSLKEGLILTENESKEVKKDGMNITVCPVHQWLLDLKQF